MHCLKNVDVGGFSLGEDTLATIGDESKYPNTTPAAGKLIGPAWACVCELNGSWAEVKLSWQSLLATPGMLLLRTGGGNEGWRGISCKYAFYGMLVFALILSSFQRHPIVSHLPNAYAQRLLLSPFRVNHGALPSTKIPIAKMCLM